MNEELSKLLGNMLQNPDALKGLMSSGTSDNDNPIQSGGDLETSVANMMSALSRTDDRRINLLTAVRPFMSQKRAAGIDRAIQILKLTKLTEVMRTERK